MKKVLRKTLSHKLEMWVDDSWETKLDEYITVLKTLPYKKDDIFDFFKTNSTIVQTNNTLSRISNDNKIDIFIAAFGSNFEFRQEGITVFFDTRRNADYYMFQELKSFEKNIEILIEFYLKNK